MNVGEKNVSWNMGFESAADLIQAINLVCTTSILRVDGDGFKVYHVGDQVRVDIAPEFYR